MYYLHYRTALTVELMQLPQGMWITLLKGTGCIKKKKKLRGREISKWDPNKQNQNWTRKCSNSTVFCCCYCVATLLSKAESFL